jgi:zinc transport system ATP-binding protein
VQRAVVLRHGAVVHDGAPPRPTHEHGADEHDHVHPHDDDALAQAPGAGLRWEP